MTKMEEIRQETAKFLARMEDVNERLNRSRYFANRLFGDPAPETLRTMNNSTPYKYTDCRTQNTGFEER